MAPQPKGNPLPIDNDVQVPEAVRRAAAAADAAMKAANPPPPEPPAPANNDTITIAPPPAPERLPNQVPLTIEPAPPPAPQPPAPQPAPNAENGSWEQKYNSMLGRYRDATTQLQQQNGRIEALENMLASIQTAPRAPAPVPPAQAQLITDKDREDFGPEMLAVMERVAQQVVQPLTQVPQQLDDLRSRLQGVTTKTEMTDRQRMHAQLDSALPEWQQINHMDEFKAWLALQDPFAGVIRHKLLTDAYGRNDAARVLNFFKGFISELAATSPAAPTSAAPQPAPSAAPAKPTLESLAAPGRARTAASPPAPAEKQTIRTSDIQAFYTAVRKGAYRGREAEQAALEAELHQAMREGRVITDT